MYIAYCSKWKIRVQTRMYSKFPIMLKMYIFTQKGWKGNSQLVNYNGGFLGSSAGKESACNVGDPGLIPGLGRSTGKGIGPLQYFWASLVTQLVKNPPAMQETWFRSLGWEDPLQKGKATLSSILAWRIPRTV